MRVRLAGLINRLLRRLQLRRLYLHLKISEISKDIKLSAAATYSLVGSRKRFPKAAVDGQMETCDQNRGRILPRGEGNAPQ